MEIPKTHVRPTRNWVKSEAGIPPRGTNIRLSPVTATQAPQARSIPELTVRPTREEMERNSDINSTSATGLRLNELESSSTQASYCTCSCYRAGCAGHRNVSTTLIDAERQEKILAAQCAICLGTCTLSTVLWLPHQF
jgi:hypothetical protein